MGGGRKRGRSQRRHFKEERENVWKDNPKRPPPSAGGVEGEGNGWQPFATENPAFEDYYKVAAWFRSRVASSFYIFGLIMACSLLPFVFPSIFQLNLIVG
jgi:hypothetical protein